MEGLDIHDHPCNVRKNVAQAGDGGSEAVQEADGNASCRAAAWGLISEVKKAMDASEDKYRWDCSTVCSVALSVLPQAS